MSCFVRPTTRTWSRAGVRTCTFRHGLLRDAIYDDLLPGRAAICTRGTQTRSKVAPTRGIFLTRWRRWDRSLPIGTPPATFRPRWRRRSGRGWSPAGTAPRRQQGRFGQALELWWLVLKPETTSGFDRADLLLMLGDAAGSQGDLNRWKAMVEEAAELLEPEGDPMLASRVYSALGVLVGFGIVDSRSPQLRRAAEYAGEAEGPDLAKVLIARAAVHARGHRYGLALADASRAVSLSTETGSVPEQVAALVEAAVARTMLGQCRAGLDTHARAVRLAVRNGRTGDALMQQGHLAWRHLLAGDIDRGLKRSPWPACRRAGRTHGGGRLLRGTGSGVPAVAGAACGGRRAAAGPGWAGDAGLADPFLPRGCSGRPR